jgi:hypothetical protein
MEKSKEPERKVNENLNNFGFLRVRSQKYFVRDGSLH